MPRKMRRVAFIEWDRVRKSTGYQTIRSVHRVRVCRCSAQPIRFENESALNAAPPQGDERDIASIKGARLSTPAHGQPPQAPGLPPCWGYKSTSSDGVSRASRIFCALSSIQARAPARRGPPSMQSASRKEMQGMNRQKRDNQLVEEQPRRRHTQKTEKRWNIQQQRRHGINAKDETREDQKIGKRKKRPNRQA